MNSFLLSLLEYNTFFAQRTCSMSPPLRHKSWHGLSRHGLLLWPLITVLLFIPQHSLHFTYSLQEWSAVWVWVNSWTPGPATWSPAFWPWQWLQLFVSWFSWLWHQSLWIVRRTKAVMTWKSTRKNIQYSQFLLAPIYGGGHLTNVQCKAIQNCHNESPLYTNTS
jgi:hypothetical protein